MPIPQLPKGSRQISKSIEIEMTNITESKSGMMKTNDEEILAHFGKRQQLRVRLLQKNFSTMTVLKEHCRGTLVLYRFWVLVVH